MTAAVTRLGLYGGPAAPYPNELDAGPVAFSFLAVYGAALSQSNVTSNVVVMSGIADEVNVTLSGHASAEYSKNGGAWTTAAGVATNGDEFQVRLDADSAYSTGRTCLLTIGSQSATFLVETLRDPNAVSEVVAFTTRLQTGRR